MSRGRKHEYLGMNLEYTHDKKVIIDMIDYITDVLRDAPQDMDGTAITLATNNLFQINETSPSLNPDNDEIFHHFITKLLFLCKRDRPDIQTAITYLCTRVQNPNDDVWMKLTRVIK